jgi:hypothetical protein
MLLFLTSCRRLWQLEPVLPTDWHEVLLLVESEAQAMHLDRWLRQRGGAPQSGNAEVQPHPPSRDSSSQRICGCARCWGARLWRA